VYDFNQLETRARELFKENSFRDALHIYLFMADGDPSLDAGYLGERIALCYQSLGDLHSAKYWYGRAVEENPEVRIFSSKKLEEMKEIGIAHLLLG
jgi:tetratricopeptide (TPR) repeat protein